MERQIIGGLKSSISAHGPITRDFVSSAAKRINSNIKGWLIEQGKGATWEEIAALCEAGPEIRESSEANAPTYIWSNGWVFGSSAKKLEER